MQRSTPTRTTSTGSRTTASNGWIVSVEGPWRWQRGQPEGPRVFSMTAMMVAPQFWIAILRVVVGLWFLKAVWTKLTIAVALGVIPYPAVSPRFLAFQPKRVAEFAAGNPVAWYKDFLENSVIPHANAWAMLQAYGEAAVGVGLVLGLLTGLSGFVGLFLAVNYGLATQWMSFGQQGFHLLLTTSMIIFVTARAGRAWGIDALILSRTRAGAARWLRLVL